MRCVSTRKRALLAAGVAAVAASIFACPALAQLSYEERIERFEIGVRDETPAAIWAALNRYGPLVDGRGAIGAAQARIRWYDMRTKRSARGCMLDSAKVQVSVTLILPEWERAWRTSPDMQQYWACVERTVTTHEQRHAEIWRETGERIERSLQSLAAWMPCDELQLRIEDATNGHYKVGQRRQMEFDAADRRRPRYQLCAAQSARENASADRLSRAPGTGPSGRSSASASASAAEPDRIFDDGGLGGTLVNLAIAIVVLLAGAAAYAGTMGLVMRSTSDDEPFA